MVRPGHERVALAGAEDLLVAEERGERQVARQVGLVLCRRVGVNPRKNALDLCEREKS